MLALLAVSLWVLGIVARRTAWRLVLVPAPPPPAWRPRPGQVEPLPVQDDRS